MKKKIDSLVSFYKEASDVNNSLKSAYQKSLAIKEKIDRMGKEHWITRENVIKRKKVSLRSKFGYLILNKGRENLNFLISSLNISYMGETDLRASDPAYASGLSGICLVLTLKSKHDQRADIAIAYNESCAPLPTLHFYELENKMYWENCTIEFKDHEGLETVIDFCKSALNEVNEKLVNANLKAMTKMFHVS